MVKLSKGFTVIELVVAIVIITLLVVVVFVNVIQYINRGKDAAIKQQMTELFNLSAQIYTRDGAYDNMNGTDSSNIQTSVSTYSPTSGLFPIHIYAQKKQFCAYTQLWDGSQWCIDNKGYVGVGQNQCQGGTGELCTSSI